MGSGEFGSNGSVHWKVTYEDGNGPAHVDWDTRRYEDVGRTKGHPRMFRVTARYRNYQQARAALQRALARLQTSDGDRNVVELDVNLRKKQRTPGTTDAWEIKVDW